MATIPEIEARIQARWTTGKACTREESAELGRLLTALEAEKPPGDFSTHVLEVLHIPARDAQRFMQQSRESEGGRAGAHRNPRPRRGESHLSVQKRALPCPGFWPTSVAVVDSNLTLWVKDAIQTP